jgi:hypothetical protein
MSSKSEVKFNPSSRRIDYITYEKKETKKKAMKKKEKKNKKEKAPAFEMLGMPFYEADSDDSDSGDEGAFENTPEGRAKGDAFILNILSQVMSPNNENRLALPRYGVEVEFPGNGEIKFIRDKEKN